MPKIQFILGSTREGRNGDKVLAWLKDVASGRADFQSEFIDLRDWNLPFFNDSQLPGSGQYSFDYTKKWSAKVAEADGYVLVTPEYNHGYSAVLKNALDHLYREWNRKPVAFVSYGGMAGGARAVEQLRQVVLELQMAPIRETVIIPGVSKAFDTDGTLVAGEAYDAQANRMFDELLWWATALERARKA